MTHKWLLEDLFLLPGTCSVALLSLFKYSVLSSLLLSTSPSAALLLKNLPYSIQACFFS